MAWVVFDNFNDGWIYGITYEILSKLQVSTSEEIGYACKNQNAGKSDFPFLNNSSFTIEQYTFIMYSYF